MSPDHRKTIDDFFATLNAGDRLVFARTRGDHFHPEVTIETFKRWGPEHPHLHTNYGVTDYTFIHQAHVDRGALQTEHTNGHGEPLRWTVLPIRD